MERRGGTPPASDVRATSTPARPAADDSADAPAGTAAARPEAGATGATRAPMRIGLIGFGTVGRAVAELVASGVAGEAALVGVLVRDPRRYAGSELVRGARFVRTAGELVALRPAIVVEAAGHGAVRDHVPPVLEAGIDVLAISVGALADESMLARLRTAAEAGGSRLRVVPGAIGGLDAIGAAALARVDRVVHVVRKPPAALLSAEELDRFAADGGERVLFAGPAREAALRFPANVNVVAAVSLAGIGLDRTEARVIADPRVTRNTHEVLVEGSFGRLSIRMENAPTDNPRTGRIVPLSIVRALRAAREPITVGC